MRRTIKNKRGAALIWVTIFCSVLILISTTITGFILKDTRFSYKIGESYTVYGAAKSGVSWSQKYVENIGGSANLSEYPSSVNQVFELNEIIVEVVIIKADDDPESECNIADFLYCAESIAVHNNSNVTRKIVYKDRKYQWDQKIAKDYPDLKNNDLVFAESSESLGVQFDFWGNDLNSNWELGIASPDSGGEIYIKFSDDDIKLVAGHPTAIGDDPLYSTNFVEVESLHLQEEYAYRATLEYIKNASAVLTISKRYVDPTDFNYKLECVGVASLNLASINFGELKNIKTNIEFEKIEFNGMPPERSMLFKANDPDSEIYVANFEVRGLRVLDYSASPPTPTPEALVSICEVWGEDDPGGEGSAIWNNPEEIFSNSETDYARLNSPNGFDDWGHITIDYGEILPAGSEIKYTVRTNRGNQRKFRIYTRTDDCGIGESTGGWELLFESTVPNDNVFRGDSVNAASEFRYVRFDYLFGSGYSVDSTFDIYNVRNTY